MNLAFPKQAWSWNPFVQLTYPHPAELGMFLANCCPMVVPSGQRGRASSAVSLFLRSSLLAAGLTEDAQKNKLIKVKCAAAMRSLVDHKWERQNQWQPFCRQRPEAWATGGMGARDLGRANALAAATWVIRCVRKTDKQRAARVDGTGNKHSAWPPGPCQHLIPPLAPCSCTLPWVPH